MTTYTTTASFNNNSSLTLYYGKDDVFNTGTADGILLMGTAAVTLTVEAGIVSLAKGIGLGPFGMTASFHNMVVITKSASINTRFEAVWENGNNNTIRNAGELLSTDFSGVAIYGGLNTLSNSGYIGGFNKGVTLSGSVNTIYNSGTIEVASFDTSLNDETNAAIWIDSKAGQINYIINSGTITGPSRAFLGEAGDEIILNSGSIKGTSLLRGGVDNFTNNGHIMGAVSMGDGNDYFSNLEGTVQDGKIDLGADDDIYVGGKHDEDTTIAGGAGNDTYYINWSEGWIQEEKNGGTDWIVANISLVLNDNVENLQFKGLRDLNATGNSQNNEIYGNAGANRLSGQGGADILEGKDGADLLYGGSGTDRAAYWSSSEGVTVSLVTGKGAGGDAEGDRLYGIENLSGSVHNDVLTGDKNANALAGYKGTDRLTGGAGKDVFEFGTGDGKDTIADFKQTGAEADRIDLSDFDAITSFTDLKDNHMSDSGANVVIKNGSDMLIILNAHEKDFVASDFLI